MGRLHTSTHEQHLSGEGWFISSLEKMRTNQVFMPGFPECGNIQAESLEGVLVIEILLKQGIIRWDGMWQGILWHEGLE